MTVNRDTFRAVILLALLTLAPLSGAGRLCAQERKIQNRPFLDDRVWHYGFLVGFNMQDLRLANNGTAYVNQNGGVEYWYADVPEYTPGFSVGVLGELKANDWLSVRFIPTMHFGDKKVVFKEQRRGAIVEQYVKSTYLSVPIDLKVSAARFNNYRPYVVTGLAPTVDLTVKKGKELLVKRSDMMFEIGMGLDLYYPFFKMIPELKFCFGLNNVLDKNRTDLKDASLLKYSDALDRAQNGMIVLTLYFE
ncbi:MAG: PorT family protein [Bacteroidaceae bacterium]|nr:PorT family protein [Bacteroidaceae bacterium]